MPSDLLACVDFSCHARGPSQSSDPNLRQVITQVFGTYGSVPLAALPPFFASRGCPSSCFLFLERADRSRTSMSWRASRRAVRAVLSWSAQVVSRVVSCMTVVLGPPNSQQQKASSFERTEVFEPKRSRDCRRSLRFTICEFYIYMGVDQYSWPPHFAVILLIHAIETEVLTLHDKYEIRPGRSFFFSLPLFPAFFALLLFRAMRRVLSASPLSALGPLARRGQHLGEVRELGVPAWPVRPGEGFQICAASQGWGHWLAFLF